MLQPPTKAYYLRIRSRACRVIEHTEADPAPANGYFNWEMWSDSYRETPIAPSNRLARGWSTSRRRACGKVALCFVRIVGLTPKVRGSLRKVESKVARGKRGLRTPIAVECATQFVGSGCCVPGRSGGAQQLKPNQAVAQVKTTESWAWPAGLCAKVGLYLWNPSAY
jgi:hypothetical protein